MTFLANRWKRVPWGFVGMLVLVVSVERFLTRHTLDFTRPESIDWRFNGKNARDKTVGRDFLIFGTSMTQQGLLPRVLCEKTGGRAFNLSICAGQAPSSYFLLKRAIDAGARPRAVLVDFHPRYLEADYLSAEDFWPELLEPGEAFDLAREGRNPAFFARTLVSRWLPSVRGRVPIRRTILGALRGEDDSLGMTSLMYMHNKNQNDGALVVASNPAFRGEVTAPQVGLFLTGSHRINPINARYVRRFMALARSRGIRVYWVIPPLSPQLQEKRDQSGLDDGYTAFIREIQEEYANLCVLDSRKASYSNGVFIDASHLDGYGATAFSEAVGDVLSRDPASRWIAMPAFRAPSRERNLPDLQDSMTALREKYSTKR